MDNYSEICVHIDSEVATMFDIALKINKETQDVVLERMIRQYISDSFGKASRSMAVQSPPQTRFESSMDNLNEDYGKATRRIPLWAQKPQQYNHRIIKAYLELKDENGVVELKSLIERCNDPIRYQATFTPDFKGNFASMKTDSGNSHGKVFEVNGDIVSIWPVVQSVLEENASLFAGTAESIKFNQLFSSLIEAVDQLPPGSQFTIKKLFGDDWQDISFNLRRRLGKDFFNYVNKGYIKNVKSLPEKDHEHIQVYEKL